MAFPESAHPYSNSLDDTQSYTITGAAALYVTFDVQTEVTYEKDYVYVMDGAGHVVLLTTATWLAGETIRVPGSTVQVRITASATGGGLYGYKVNNVSASPPAGWVQVPAIPGPFQIAPPPIDYATTSANYYVGNGFISPINVMTHCIHSVGGNKYAVGVANGGQAAPNNTPESIQVWKNIPATTPYIGGLSQAYEFDTNFVLGSSPPNAILTAYEATSGNTILIILTPNTIGVGALASVFTVTDNNNNTYTLDDSLVGTAAGVYVYRATNITGGSLLITVTSTQSVAMAVLLMEYAGTLTPDATPVHATNSSAAASAGPITTVKTNDILISALSSGTSPAFGPPLVFTPAAGWNLTNTHGAYDANIGRGQGIVAEQFAATPGAYSASWTVDNGEWVLSLLAYHSDSPIATPHLWQEMDAAHHPVSAVDYGDGTNIGFFMSSVSGTQIRFGVANSASPPLFKILIFDTVSETWQAPVTSAVSLPVLASSSSQSQFEIGQNGPFAYACVQGKDVFMYVTRHELLPPGNPNNLRYANQVTYLAYDGAAWQGPTVFEDDAGVTIHFGPWHILSGITGLAHLILGAVENELSPQTMTLNNFTLDLSAWTVTARQIIIQSLSTDNLVYAQSGDADPLSEVIGGRVMLLIPFSTQDSVNSTDYPTLVTAVSASAPAWSAPVFLTTGINPADFYLDQSFAFTYVPEQSKLYCFILKRDKFALATAFRLYFAVSANAGSSWSPFTEIYDRVWEALPGGAEFDVNITTMRSAGGASTAVGILLMRIYPWPSLSVVGGGTTQNGWFYFEYPIVLAGLCYAYVGHAPALSH